MKLTGPLLHCLHHVCEKDNEIKFHYAQNPGFLAMIIYNDRPMCNSRTVLCDGLIYGYNTCYKVRFSCFMYNMWSLKMVLIDAI